MKELKEAFICFDKEEGDNFIKVSSFGTVIRALGQNPTESELKTLVSQLNGDKVSFEQFMSIFPRLNYADFISDDEMKDMWSVFSADGGDSVSADDFKKGLQLMGDKITDDEFNTLVRQQNISGTVSYDQFVKIMQSQNTVMNP